MPTLFSQWPLLIRVPSLISSSSFQPLLDSGVISCEIPGHPLQPTSSHQGGNRGQSKSAARSELPDTLSTCQIRPSTLGRTLRPTRTAWLPGSSPPVNSNQEPNGNRPPSPQPGSPGLTDVFVGYYRLCRGTEKGCYKPIDLCTSTSEAIGRHLTESRSLS